MQILRNLQAASEDIFEKYVLQLTILGLIIYEK